MRHTTSLNDVTLEKRFVTGEVVADELAAPAAQEGACVMTPAALGEVVHDQRRCIELRTAVAPDIGPMRVPEARL
jgi:hypothetical protein